MRWWVFLWVLFTAACSSDAPTSAPDAGPQEPERSWGYPSGNAGYEPCKGPTAFTLDNGVVIMLDGYCGGTKDRNPISDPPLDEHQGSWGNGESPGYPRPDPPGDPVPF